MAIVRNLIKLSLIATSLASHAIQDVIYGGLIGGSTFTAVARLQHSNSVNDYLFFTFIRPERWPRAEDDLQTPQVSILTFTDDECSCHTFMCKYSF